MEYLILIYSEEAQWADMQQADAERVYAMYRAYSKELAEAGVLRGGSELKPTRTAKTLRQRDERVVVTDGPFAETREQLGGYYLIDVPDGDAALRWASKCPGVTHGCVEVRACAQQANVQQA